MSPSFAQTRIAQAITTHRPSLTRLNPHKPQIPIPKQLNTILVLTTTTILQPNHQTTLPSKRAHHPHSNQNPNHKNAFPHPPTNLQTTKMSFHTQTPTHSTPNPLTPTLHPHTHTPLLRHLSRPPSLHIRTPLPPQRRTHTPRPHAWLHPSTPRRPTATTSTAC